MVTRRIWSAMRALTTRWMPAAAATGSRPSRRPRTATARSAAATSRAAQVERDEVAHHGALGREGGAYDAAGRPREEEGDRLLRGERRRHDAAARAHDQRHAGHAEAAQRLGETREVALHHRAQV